MYSKLISHIRNYIHFEDSDIEILSQYITLLDLKSKQFVLEEGQVCKAYYFIETGCMRMFFHNDKGTEQTIQFALESWWMTDYMSLSNQKPSDYYIQAIENSSVLAIGFHDFQKMILESPSLERYFRLVTERALAASQFRMKLLYELSKEEIYKHFKTSFPEFVQRVPQYMLASFLGLTPEYLSEIRKKNP